MPVIDLTPLTQALQGLTDPVRFKWSPTLSPFGSNAATPDPPAMDSTILDVARSQLGVQYVWAAANPAGPEGGEGAAFDCSGFTQYVLSQFGIETPHQASEQQNQFPSIGRDELQPGDLVFFNYGRLGAGVADHVGVYIGGGQMIDASSSNDAIVEREVDWDHFIGGGQTGATAAVTKPRRRPATPAAPENWAEAVAGIPSSLSGDSRSRLASVVVGLFGPETVTPTRGRPPSFAGDNGSVKEQLYQGFMAAGRPDLARMVNTRDFQTWVAAESGWNPYSVSQYYEGHGRNYGLFQFWEGHDWTEQYYLSGEWTATPYEQAMLVARYFSGLSPDDIRRYAQQVRSGEYHGWPD